MSYLCVITVALLNKSFQGVQLSTCHIGDCHMISHDSLSLPPCNVWCVLTEPLVQLVRASQPEAAGTVQMRQPESGSKPPAKSE